MRSKAGNPGFGPICGVNVSRKSFSLQVQIVPILQSKHLEGWIDIGMDHLQTGDRLVSSLVDSWDEWNNVMICEVYYRCYA